jgi:uncharacterized RDD family membrane protein YckC
MRCPKCQYIGFDSGNRCRNCGYEFSLAVSDDPPIELSLGPDDDAGGRLADLALDPHPGRATPAAPLDDLRDAHSETSARGRHAGLEGDLPLFTSRVVDDQAPLVTPPAVPRPPLAVRRAGPLRHRAPEPPAEPLLDLAPGPPPVSAIGERFAPAAAGNAAGVAPRLTAGLIDVSLLGAISAAVIYLTLRVAELPVSDWQRVPIAPLGAFLLLLCGGYFTIFTAAGGQTIGKMLARIRVVSAAVDRDRPGSVPFATAFVRAALCFCSVVAAGAGFVPVLLRDDRRAFHDYIADTRVVSA